MATMFEAPIAHEATHYSNPYSNPEFEDEWETHESAHYSNPYSTPEFEDESDRFLGNIVRGIGGLFGGDGEYEEEFEDEGSHHSNPYSNPEWEEEWETHESSHYSNPEYEDEADRFLGNIIRGIGGLFGGDGEYEEEFEDEGSHYSNPEYEDEADRFLGKFRGIFNKIKRRAMGLARRAFQVAPGVFRAVTSLVSESHPEMDREIHELAHEAEEEVAHMAQQFTNMFAQSGEMEHPEVHEALMSELMAGNAAAAQTEAEAEAEAAVAIPLTIRFMRAQRDVSPVAPALVQANVRLVRSLRRSDPRLLELLPEIHRLSVAILRRAARIRRLTSPYAVRTLAIASRRVMRNPRRARRAIERNVALRVRAQQVNRQRGKLPLRPSPRRQRVRV